MRYIYKYVRKFFIDHSTTSASIVSTMHDEHEYFFVPRQLLAHTTKSEHARANRIVSQLDPNQINVTTDPLVKVKLLGRQQKRNSIIVHSNYGRRFAHYKSRIHQFWNVTFPTSTGIDTKLIAGTCNNPNLTRKSVRRDPSLQTQRS